MATPLKELEHRVFGSWRLLSLVDSGGMGAIFLGQHAELGTRVAIKVLLAGVDAPEEVVVRFLNEAKIGANLAHPNIARTIDLFRDDQGRSFIVMEWLDGESLGRRLQRGPCSLVEAQGIFLGACRGLAAAHRSNIVHRDIKPGNIFLAREHGELVPKLIDFGIARLAASSSHTRTGLVMGSPPYMAPEQWKGAKFVTVQSDVFALGVVLYEMLTGDNPFNGESLPEISMKVTTQRLPRHPAVPQEIYEVILAATEQKAQSRVASMDDLAARFSAAFDRARSAHRAPAAGGLSPEAPPLAPAVSTVPAASRLDTDLRAPEIATPIATPTFQSTVPETPHPQAVSTPPLPPVVPHYAPPVLIDEHSLGPVASSSSRAIGQYLLIAGPMTLVAGVLAVLTKLGTAFPDITGTLHPAPMIGAAAIVAFGIGAAAFLAASPFPVGRLEVRRAAAFVLLLLACWAALVAIAETWAAFDAWGLQWRRDAVRRQMFQLGMDRGPLWLVGLVLGAIVTWIRSTPPDEEAETAPPEDAG